MKKNIMILLILSILMIGTTYVFATEPQITIEGESEIAPGGTKTLSIKVTSADATSENAKIGGVSGKIEKDANITDIKVTAKNGWNLMYNNMEGNEQQGVFNAYKEVGTSGEAIIDIEYTVANTEGTAQIKVSDIEITTIDYNSTEVSQIVKDITIKQIEEPETPDDPQNPDNPETVKLESIEITKAPTKTTYKVGEKFDKTGMTVIAKYSDGTSKEITNYTVENGEKLEKGQTSVKITYKEGSDTKAAEQKITVNEEVVSNPKDDDTKTDEKMPGTGANSIIGIILVVGILTVVCLVKYNKYKEV